jgi:hypothetical protein
MLNSTVPILPETYEYISENIEEAASCNHERHNIQGVFPGFESTTEMQYVRLRLLPVLRAKVSASVVTGHSENVRNVRRPE